VRLFLFFSLGGLFFYWLTWRPIRTPLERWAGNFDDDKPNDLWGILFIALYMFGAPLWWWRYGLWKTLILLVSCAGAGLVCSQLIQQIPFDDPYTGIGMGFLVSNVLSRGIGAHFVAVYDARWRREILAHRATRPERREARRVAKQHRRESLQAASAAVAARNSRTDSA